MTAAAHRYSRCLVRSAARLWRLSSAETSTWTKRIAFARLCYGFMMPLEVILLAPCRSTRVALALCTRGTCSRTVREAEALALERTTGEGENSDSLRRCRPGLRSAG